MKVSSNIKAGGVKINHNEKLIGGKSKGLISKSLLIVLAALLTVFASTDAKAQAKDDGFDDIIVGPGAGPHVKVFSGATGELLLMPGQSMQIKVVNIGETNPSDPDMSIQAELMFLDDKGNILLRSVHSLAAGKTASLSLNADLIGKAGDRTVVRGAVKIYICPSDPSATPPDPDITQLIRSAVEGIDNQTQKILFIVPINY